jgi:hypothetical protein
VLVRGLDFSRSSAEPYVRILVSRRRERTLWKNPATHRVILVLEAVMELLLL